MYQNPAFDPFGSDLFILVLHKAALKQQLADNNQRLGWLEKAGSRIEQCQESRVLIEVVLGWPNVARRQNLSNFLDAGFREGGDQTSGGHMWSLPWKSSFAGPTFGFFYDLLLGAISIGLVFCIRTFCRYLGYYELGSTLSNQGNCWNMLGQPHFPGCEWKPPLKGRTSARGACWCLLPLSLSVLGWVLSPDLLPVLKSRAIDTFSTW